MCIERIFNLIYIYFQVYFSRALRADHAICMHVPGGLDAAFCLPSMFYLSCCVPVNDAQACGDGSELSCQEDQVQLPASAVDTTP